MKTLVLILTFAACSFAQCTLTINESPNIRGLKLGMTETQFKKSFGTVQYMSTAELQAVFMSSEITGIWFNFDDAGLLKRFRLAYDTTLEWNSAREFIEAIAGPLKLPTTGWERGFKELASLQCDGFDVSVNTMINSLEIIDRRIPLPPKNNNARKAAFKP